MYADFTKEQVKAIEWFYSRVCARAEDTMEKTHKLEGAHYAAMQSVLKEVRQAQTSGVVLMASANYD